MRHLAATALLLASSSALSAKGDMVLIEIKGPGLKAPIRITDSKIQEFNIWAGPGTSSGSVAGSEGFIIDWKAGAVPRPRDGIQQYQVLFYAGCRTRPDDPRCAAEQPRLVYVVGYEYDPSNKQGFVYLPRFFEPWSELNCGSICRGIEGNWFKASDDWERFVTPMLTAASRSIAPDR